MITQFLVTLFAVLAARFIVKTIKPIFFPKPFIFPERPPKFPSPWDALDRDMGQVFDSVISRIPLELKTSSFPYKLDLYSSDSQCYSPWKALIPILCARLEHVGWVVTKTPECKWSEVWIDVPRKTLD